MAEQNKRQQLEVHLAAKAKADPDFRDRLLTNPKQTIESELGMRFPELLRVTVHEEKVNQLHVVRSVLSARLSRRKARSPPAVWISPSCR